MRRKRLGLAALVVLLGLIAGLNVTVLVGGERGAIGEPVDCALVLGAGVGPDGTPSPVLQDRLSEALALYRSGRVRTILVSGDHRALAYDEPNAMRLWLEAEGVPPAAIFMDHAGLDTYSSMWRAKHVFGAARIIVVTQDFHLPRALWTARALGLSAEGASADRRRYRGAVWLELREVGSRTKAVVDVVGHRTPRHAGPKISLEQDGRVTSG